MVVNMTRAKRYEGERQRSDRWHELERDKAWAFKRNGLKEINKIVAMKFSIYAETVYNAENCSYDIVVQIGPNGTMGSLPLLKVLFEHREDFRIFPSDHLKAKLLLISG